LKVEFHPLLYQKNLLEFCHTNGIVLEGYSPFGKGAVRTLSYLTNTISFPINEKSKDLTNTLNYSY
jgi:diketogulonate reductase-like aldo/keto reductase